MQTGHLRCKGWRLRFSWFLRGNDLWKLPIKRLAKKTAIRRFFLPALPIRSNQYRRECVCRICNWLGKSAEPPETDFNFRTFFGLERAKHKSPVDESGISNRKINSDCPEDYRSALFGRSAAARSYLFCPIFFRLFKPLFTEISDRSIKPSRLFLEQLSHCSFSELNYYSIVVFFVFQPILFQHRLDSRIMLVRTFLL